jgi:hypothetical protein
MDAGAAQNLVALIQKAVADEFEKGRRNPQITEVINAALDAKFAPFMKSANQRDEEIFANIGMLSKQMNTLATLLNNGQKKAPRAAAAADPGVVKAAADAGNVVITAPAAQKKTAISKVHFQNEWAASEEFRKRYALPANEMEAIMVDPSVKKCKNDKTRTKAIAACVFAHIQLNNPALCEQFKAEHAAAKSATAAAPAQAVVEPPSP